MKGFPKLFDGHFEYVLQQVLESVDDAVLVFTDDQSIVYANRAAERVFSGGTDKLLGGNIRRLIPKERVIHFEQLIKVLHASRSRSIDLSGKAEFTGIRGKTHFYAEGRLAKFGQEQAYILVLQDITWRKAIEGELETALAHLKKISSKVVYRIEHPKIMDEFPLD